MLRSTLARTIRRAVPTITLRHAAAAAAAAAATTSYVLCERKPARRSLNAVLTESLPEALRVSFLSARQVEQTVTLLNAVLDLDNFTDEEEQLIFKHAVCQVVRAIEETLPRPFLTLCTRSAERAPSRGRYSSGDVEGLDAEQAEQEKCGRFCVVLSGPGDQDEVDLLDVSAAGSRRGGAVAPLLLLGLTAAATLALLAHASRP